MCPFTQLPTKIFFMKRFCLLLIVPLFSYVLSAQQGETASPFNMQLAERFSLNTTSFEDVRQLLGEPVFVSADRTTAQFTNGKTTAMFHFNKGGMLTELLLTGGEKKSQPLDYAKLKTAMTKPERAELQKIAGLPLEIKVSAEGTYWWYKSGNNTLSVLFGNGNTQYLYSESSQVKTTFTFSDLDFLVAGKTTVNELITRLGTPYTMQLQNAGEDRIYMSEQLQLRVLVQNNTVAHFQLENVNR